MEFYERMAATASRLLTKFGGTVTLSRITGESVDPITGVVTPGTDNSQTTIGILQKFPDNLVDGTRIKKGDRTLILDSSVEPLMTDTPEIGGDNWSVMSIETVKPASLPLVYFVHCRQ